MVTQNSYQNLPRPEALMGASKDSNTLGKALVQLLNNWYLILQQAPNFLYCWVQGFNDYAAQVVIDVSNGNLLIEAFNHNNTIKHNVEICAYGGNVSIGSTTAHSALSIATLPVFANNAAAITGGLAAHDLYRTGGDPDLVCIVH